MKHRQAEDRSNDLNDEQLTDGLNDLNSLNVLNLFGR